MNKLMHQHPRGQAIARGDDYVTERHGIHRAEGMAAQHGIGERAACQNGEGMSAHELHVSFEQHDGNGQQQAERCQWRCPDEAKYSPDPEQRTPDKRIVHE